MEQFKGEFREKFEAHYGISPKDVGPYVGPSIRKALRLAGEAATNRIKGLRNLVRSRSLDTPSP
jgi:hypothetical protein